MGYRNTLFGAALIAVCGATAVPAVPAPHIDVSAGRSATSQDRWTRAVFIDATGGTHHFDKLSWQPAFTLGWLGERRMRAERMHHHVWVGAAGVRLVDWWRRAFFSFQLGVVGGRTDALSSAGEFVSTLGWQGDHWQLMLRHISNGHVFPGKNLGETMLLAGVRF